MIYVEKNFRRILAGSVKEAHDQWGNPIFVGLRCDEQTVVFYNRGACEHWLRLGGLLHG